MELRAVVFLILLLIPIGAQQAFATLIDFDTFPDGTVPDDRTRLTNQYAVCDVSLFTTNDAAGPEIQLASVSNSPANLLTPAGLRFVSTGFIGIEFSSPLSGDFSVFAIQIKTGGLRLQAFDSANNPVGTPYDIPPSSNDRFETMTVRGDDIVKLVISQIVPQTGGFVDGYFIDDLEFPGSACVIQEVQLIGGELLPIETTSLLLASTSSSAWLIPVVLSGIGIGLFVVSRKS